MPASVWRLPIVALSTLAAALRRPHDPLRACASSLHLLAMSLWLGHMFVWSLFAGPALKRIEPPATAEMLRDRSVYLGAFGWPALAVLVPPASTCCIGAASGWSTW